MKVSSIMPTGLKSENQLKRSDGIALGTVAFILAFFTLVPGALDGFKYLSKEHGFLMSFIKFAILATFGECLALRIKCGVYNMEGFGVAPKIIVWGFLGILIKISFIVFATGTPNVLAYIGFPVDTATQSTGFATKLLECFAISGAMNLIFAPVMMTLHKITDIHIGHHGGKVGALMIPIDFAGILQKIDWQVMFHFIFKKTIPFFWIPAHTITFMLPGEYQILFAALLGIALGLILAFASNKK